MVRLPEIVFVPPLLGEGARTRVAHDFARRDQFAGGERVDAHRAHLHADGERAGERVGGSRLLQAAGAEIADAFGGRVEIALGEEIAPFVRGDGRDVELRAGARDRVGAAGLRELAGSAAADGFNDGGERALGKRIASGAAALRAERELRTRACDGIGAASFWEKVPVPASPMVSRIVFSAPPESE